MLNKNRINNISKNIRCTGTVFRKKRLQYIIQKVKKTLQTTPFLNLDTSTSHSCWKYCSLKSMNILKCIVYWQANQEITGDRHFFSSTKLSKKDPEAKICGSQICTFWKGYIGSPRVATDSFSIWFPFPFSYSYWHIYNCWCMYQWYWKWEMECINTTAFGNIF